jgi:hypothetical protein
MILKEELPESLLDACAEIEAGIEEAQRLLLDPRAETLDRSESVLTRVIQILEALVSKPSPERNPAASASLRQIKRATRKLGIQVAHASNLHRGWAQLRLVIGYTNQGLPVFVTGEERSSFHA